VEHVLTKQSPTISDARAEEYLISDARAAEYLINAARVLLANAESLAHDDGFGDVAKRIRLRIDSLRDELLPDLRAIISTLEHKEAKPRDKP